jgi:hypothetical protein
MMWFCAGDARSLTPLQLTKANEFVVSKFSTTSVESLNQDAHQNDTVISGLGCMVSYGWIRLVVGQRGQSN